VPIFSFLQVIFKFWAAYNTGIVSNKCAEQKKKSPAIYTHAGDTPAFQWGKEQYYELLEMCFVLKDIDILLDNNVILCKYTYREMKNREVW